MQTAEGGNQTIPRPSSAPTRSAEPAAELERSSRVRPHTPPNPETRTQQAATAPLHDQGRAHKKHWAPWNYRPLTIKWAVVVPRGLGGSSPGGGLGAVAQECSSCAPPHRALVMAPVCGRVFW